MGFRKSSYTKREFQGERHRFEHWYRDDSVYFITSKVRDGRHLFRTQSARDIFWLKFEEYTVEAGFLPWVTTLMSNHYHMLGYLKKGEALGEMMRKLHGSIAWLVMKKLDVKHVPFWRSKGNKDYFDGCIRDVLQAERAYRYTLTQSVRAGLCETWRSYENTHVHMDMDEAIRRAVEVKAFMEDVPYARYEKRSKRRGHLR